MLTKFLRDDDGAVTIDWVALTAGILLLGIAVVYGVFEGGVKPLTAEHQQQSRYRRAGAEFGRGRSAGQLQRHRRTTPLSKALSATARYLLW